MRFLFRNQAYDVYDLAALTYLYKRMKETEVISEAHHVVIDEAQDYGMMAYAVLKYCMKDCTYTVMGDVSQNIHFGLSGRLGGAAEAAMQPGWGQLWNPEKELP